MSRGCSFTVACGHVPLKHQRKYGTGVNGLLTIVF
jgi:hypothetical protein